MKASHDVIVCVHNAPLDTKKCIDSLILDWECSGLGSLIIVDDFSGAATRDLIDAYAAAHPFVRVVRTERQSYYTVAANLGLSASDASIKTLLNSDTQVTRGWALGIRRVFSFSGAIGIVGPLSNAASTQSVPHINSAGDQTAVNEIPPEVSLAEFAEYVGSLSVGLPIPFCPLVHGFCFSMRDDVLRAIGGFDDSAFPRGYGEETDFCLRAEDAGFVNAIALDSFVFHAKSKSYQSEERVRFMRDGMANLVAKHGRDRIVRSDDFMKNNPFLQKIREGVLRRWSSFYGG